MHTHHMTRCIKHLLALLVLVISFAGFNQASHAQTAPLTPQSSPQAHAAFDLGNPFKWSWNTIKNISSSSQRWLAKHPKIAKTFKIGGKVLMVGSLLMFMSAHHKSMVKKCPWLKKRKGFTIVPHNCEPSIKTTGQELFHAFII